MPLPDLATGLIVRYEYLWHVRSLSDASTADKDHPACVVATFRQEDLPEDFVVYLPISHSPPQSGEAGIELTEAAKRAAGLDAARQWVLISECNIDMWPYDVRQIPNTTGRFHYGILPPSTFKMIRNVFSERMKNNQVSRVFRIKP